jgi:hypothetical protein
MATKSESAAPKWVMAKENVCITVGARPISYRKLLVRDRHTGKLVEIDDTDSYPDDPNTGRPPNILDPGDEGIPYAFSRGEKVPADHEAVAANPGFFMAYDPDVAK